MPLLEPDRRPEPLTGVALIEAHRDFFEAVTLGQTTPTTEGVLNTVLEAARRVENCLGPFVMHATEASKAFDDHFAERYGGTRERTPFEALAIDAKNVDGILFAPIEACSYAPEPMADRGFMVEAALAFGKNRDYVAQAINSGRRELQKNLLRSERIFGLREKDIVALSKAAMRSIGVRSYFFAKNR